MNQPQPILTEQQRQKCRAKYSADHARFRQRLHIIVVGMLYDIAVVKCFVSRKNRFKSAQVLFQRWDGQGRFATCPCGALPDASRSPQVCDMWQIDRVRIPPQAKPLNHPQAAVPGAGDKLIAATAAQERQDHD